MDAQGLAIRVVAVDDERALHACGDHLKGGEVALVVVGRDSPEKVVAGH
jgi:hypothetical protein